MRPRSQEDPAVPIGRPCNEDKGTIGRLAFALESDTRFVAPVGRWESIKAR